LKHFELIDIPLEEIAFPRSIERGPIEASSSYYGANPHEHFRAQLSAAPLKLVCVMPVID